jgi:hypothetical protein
VYPLLSVFLTMLWFFLMILWVFLLVRVITDIFRSQDLSGWAQAGWLVFVIVLPLLGVLVYLGARGGTMADREMASAKSREEAFRAYVRDAAREGTVSADDLAKLTDLHDRGIIGDAEYEQAREKVQSRPAA